MAYVKKVQVGTNPDGTPKYEYRESNEGTAFDTRQTMTTALGTSALNSKGQRVVNTTDASGNAVGQLVGQTYSGSRAATPTNNQSIYFQENVRKNTTPANYNFGASLGGQNQVILPPETTTTTPTSAFDEEKRIVGELTANLKRERELYGKTIASESIAKAYNTTSSANFTPEEMTAEDITAQVKAEYESQWDINKKKSLLEQQLGLQEEKEKNEKSRLKEQQAQEIADLEKQRSKAVQSATAMYFGGANAPQSTTTGGIIADKQVQYDDIISRTKTANTYQLQQLQNDIDQNAISAQQLLMEFDDSQRAAIQQEVNARLSEKATVKKQAQQIGMGYIDSLISSGQLSNMTPDALMAFSSQFGLDFGNIAAIQMMEQQKETISKGAGIGVIAQRIQDGTATIEEATKFQQYQNLVQLQQTEINKLNAPSETQKKMMEYAMAAEQFAGNPEIMAVVDQFYGVNNLDKELPATVREFEYWKTIEDPKEKEMFAKKVGLDDPTISYLTARTSTGAAGAGGGTFVPGNSGMRTDRHNNPTAFTTDIAKQAGLVEGVDYVLGDPFPGDSKMKTAKLLGDAVDKTIRVIDNIGFYTQKGTQRWSHTAMPQEQWNAMTRDQKANVIAQMYQNEGGNGQFVAQTGGAQVSPILEQATDGELSLARGLIDGSVSISNIDNKEYNRGKIKAMAEELSAKQVQERIEKIKSGFEMTDDDARYLRYMNTSKFPQDIDTAFEQDIFRNNAQQFKSQISQQMGKYQQLFDIYLANAQMGVGFSDADVERKMSTLTNAMLNDDFPEVKRQVANGVLGGGTGTKYDDMQTTLNLIDDVKKDIQNYKAKGGDMGIISGTFEQVANKVGKTSDPDLASLKFKLNNITRSYTRAISGLAVTDQEYGRIYADNAKIIGDTEFNETMLDAFAQTAKIEQETAIKRQLGKHFDLLFGNEDTLPNQVSDFDILEAGKRAFNQMSSQDEEMEFQNIWNSSK